MFLGTCRFESYRPHRYIEVPVNKSFKQEIEKQLLEGSIVIIWERKFPEIADIEAQPALSEIARICGLEEFKFTGPCSLDPEWMFVGYGKEK